MALACEVVSEDHITRSKPARGAIADPDFHLPRENKDVLPPRGWDFLSDFQQRGTLALDALRAQAAQSLWGVASNGRILDEPRLRAMEELYLPN